MRWDGVALAAEEKAPAAFLCTPPRALFIPREHPTQLALCYASLVKEMWCCSDDERRDAFRPFEMKRAVAVFRNEFAGYGQHDAQELLTWLLDGLHEVRSVCVWPLPLSERGLVRRRSVSRYMHAPCTHHPCIALLTSCRTSTEC